MMLPDPAGGLTLRPWRDEDAAALVAVADDPQLRTFTGLRAADTQQALQWLAVQHTGWAEGSRWNFAIVDARQQLLGHVVLKRGDRPDSLGEVGYWTAAAARGQGVASRAVQMLTRWAFATFAGLERVELRHRVDNEASCRVAIKSGYAYEATLSAELPYPVEGHLHVRERP